MESHKNLVDSMEHWIQQDASLLAMTNEVDYDQDGEFELYNLCPFELFPSSAYAQQLEDMIAEKQEQLATLREKTRAFRSGFRFAPWVQVYLLRLTTDEIVLEIMKCFAGSVCQKKRFRAPR